MILRVNVFHRLGRLAARRPRLIVAVWALALLAALPFAPQAGSVLRAGGFSSDELEAARARHSLESELGLPPSALVIVVRSETESRAGDPAFEAAVAQALAGVADARHVAGIRGHQLSPRQVSADGRTVYEIVGLDLTPDDSPAALEPVREAIREVPGISTFLAGAPAFYGDIQTVSEQDLQRSEFVSLPLAALALLLIFGTVVAAGVPLVVGGSAVIIALGLVFLVGSVVPMSIFVLNLATLLGLGLGVDYSLLLTSRFREELARRGGGRTVQGAIDPEVVEEAVALTVSTAGRAVFFSGLTVLLGVLALTLFTFQILRSVGIAGAIVVGLAVLSAVTLLPAVLALLGPRIELLSVGAILGRVLPVTRPATLATSRSTPGRWERLAYWVMERPVQVFVPTLALLVLLGLPFLHVRFNAPDATILPPEVPSREAFDLLSQEFGPGEFAPLSLAIRTPGPALRAENVGRLFDYSRAISADPRVQRVEGLVDVDPRLTRAQYQILLSQPEGIPDRYIATVAQATTRDDLVALTVVTPYGPNHPDARALVADLRDPTSGLAPPEGFSVLIGGGAAEVVDVVDRIAADFPRAALFIVVSTYLVLFVLLRSLVLPAKALVMNTLSILASFGALVWIFQDGNLSALLGFRPLGFVETSQPVILFCVLFGLSMDYEVFLLSRMKEVYDRTGDNREAVARGLERSGRIVSSAALIVVLVAGSFALADIVLIKALGIGMAVAVALDATVVRALLVPATMRLLGDWNWWLPERLERFIAARLPIVEGA
jgi:RND superfamily putative drug exporter